VIVIRS